VHYKWIGALIMSIKRLTIELNDVADKSHPTTSPCTLISQQTFPINSGGTELPSEQAEYQENDVNPRLENGVQSRVVGRTLADLVFTFMNQPEFMATLFFFLSAIITISRIQKFSDIWVTIIIAIGLNIFWFGIKVLRKLFRQ